MRNLSKSKTTYRSGRMKQCCPKCGYQQFPAPSCQACGVIFARIKTGARGDQTKYLATETAHCVTNITTPHRLLLTPRDCNVPTSIGYTLLWLVLLVYGGRLMLAGVADNIAGESFLHLVNLPFHEAGHLFLRPFGHFTMSAGGTLGQLLTPLLCLTVLLISTRDPFGASVCSWWLGENLLDIAPYINDARAGVLPLVGGNFGHSSPYGFHDWEYLLNETGLLHYDHLLARLAHLGGSIIIIGSLIWGGYILYKQRQANGSTGLQARLREVIK